MEDRIRSHLPKRAQNARGTVLREQLLKRAKTDAIDAQTLAHLAALLQPALWTPPPPSITRSSSASPSVMPSSMCSGSS